jgi:hypothetical protein
VAVIKLSSPQGFTAEISDYHYDQQNFCFTLTNTSSLSINGIGGALGVTAFVNIVSQSDNTLPGKYFVEMLTPHTLNGVPMSFALTSVGGAAPGASTTICLSGLSLPAEDIAHNLFVTFMPAVTLDCEAPEVVASERLLVQFTRFTDTEECWVITNIGNEPITAVGLDLGNAAGPFDLLSVTPARQLFGQHLKFSDKPGKVEGLPAVDLAFALITGGQFSKGNPQKGVQPGESSAEFCFAGNFAGLTDSNIAEHTYVRVPDLTRPCVNLGPPVGQGQTGVLGGEPR